MEDRKEVAMRILPRKPMPPASRIDVALDRAKAIGRRVDPRIAMAGAGGLLVGYLFDPKMGRARRAQMRQRMAGTLRGVARRSKRAGRGINARAHGYRQRVAHLRQVPKQWDDVTLVQKVQSEAFGGAGVPKGRISVDAHDGIIVLRGAVDDPHLIKRLEHAVARVPGVQGVDNLLHARGQPAPNKMGSLRAR
jgi:osmotically-inducible protein OsmY